MKKTYQVPEIEVMMMESTALMQDSMGVYTDKVGADAILTRDIIFDDDEE